MINIDMVLQGLLKDCNSMCADYLFQKDKQYDTEYDTGDKTMQCGRHNDIFKLWLSWRAKVPAQPPAASHCPNTSQACAYCPIGRGHTVTLFLNLSFRKS